MTPAPPMRRDAWPGRRRSVPLLATLLLAAVLTGCSNAPGAGSSRATAPTLSVPLATSVHADGATWATLPMGDLDQRLNSFWQLLERPDGSARWSNQVEATAVATNGGIAFAPAATSLTAAVLPSQELHFSPLVVTSDSGGSWSSAVLDAPLRAVPDALAGDGTGDGTGDVLALVGTVDDSEVLQSTGGDARWRSLVRQSQLAAGPGGRRCGLSELTAVAEVDGADVIGGACDHPGTTGIFVDGADGWRLDGPALPGGLAAGRVQVLSLWSAGSGLTAVVAVSHGRGVDLASAWWAPGGSWQVSAPLALSAGQLLSLGPDGASGVFALIRVAGRSAVELDSGPSGSWTVLPAPPAGTATLAFVPGTAPQALVVHQAVLTVWSLGAAGWGRGQTLDVSIQYGSSS